MSDVRQVISREVILDGATFESVDFKDCRLIYRGGSAPSFQDCRFLNATFTFEGAAGNTLSFLRAMAPVQTNMQDVVLGLLPELRA